MSRWWRCGTEVHGQWACNGWRLDRMTLKVFSNLNDCMILWWEQHDKPTCNPDRSSSLWQLLFPVTSPCPGDPTKWMKRRCPSSGIQQGAASTVAWTANRLKGEKTAAHITASSLLRSERMLSLKALIYFSMLLHLEKKKKREKTLTAEFPPSLCLRSTRGEPSWAGNRMRSLYSSQCLHISVNAPRHVGILWRQNIHTELSESLKRGISWLSHGENH